MDVIYMEQVKYRSMKDIALVALKAPIHEHKSLNENGLQVG